MSVFKAIYILIGVVTGLGIAAAADGIIIAVTLSKEKKRRRHEKAREEELARIMESLLQDQARKGLKDRDRKED